MIQSGTKSNIPVEMFEALQRAFEDFQNRAEKLGKAYEAMQADFGKLNLELESKNLELAESLAKQEEIQTYLNSILESMNNGVVGIDILGKITSFNKAASEISGYSSEYAIGKSYRDVFTNDPEGGMSLLNVMSTGKSHVWDEKVIWHRDGYPVPVSFQTALLKDQRGRILGAVEVFSDISRIKELEREMQQTKTMAALGEMSATVAHELRNPLGAMGVWAGLLDRDFEKEDPRRKTLKKIIDGLGRLNRIVSNLLLYSRPVNAQYRIIQLPNILTETINFVEIEIERLGQDVEVEKSWSDESDVYVKGDPEKLQQVIMNLCFNAIQAMPDGGKLTVSIDEKPSGKKDYTCFRITDTGVGIEKERMDKIFDPFHTTKENGTGLGLAIVKKFIDHHNGYINVSSSLKRGTTFAVFLPRIN